MSLHDRWMKKEAGLLSATVFTPKRPAFRVTFYQTLFTKEESSVSPADRLIAVRRYLFTILR